jgi:DNA-binding transcriptional MerR regulator
MLVNTNEECIMQAEELLNFLNNNEFLTQIDSTKIPNINLYMDQVLSFMNENLEHNKRNSKDKILTKSMINNYVKNELIPKPENKKYYPQHIISLIYIFYLKQILSLDDVKIIMNYYEKNHFDGEALSELYKVFLLSEQKDVLKLEKDLEELARITFEDYRNFDDDEIIFLFIMLLSSRANTYKIIIEKLTDYLSGGKKS